MERTFLGIRLFLVLRLRPTPMYSKHNSKSSDSFMPTLGSILNIKFRRLKTQTLWIFDLVISSKQYFWFSNLSLIITLFVILSNACNRQRIPYLNQLNIEIFILLIILYLTSNKINYYHYFSGFTCFFYCKTSK